ncbi:MAG: family 10 glycosylhydrolase [Gemmatimonadota bacterium]|nr:family 10 glycosylhydrolase [Gemmatimonadota bacterium]
MNLRRIVSIPISLGASLSLILPSAIRAQRPLAANDTAPPPVMREFRAVWIATVANIDWPSRPGLSTAQQQAEMVALLDRAVAMHMNAVVFQVRPQADALYQSDSEPWSPFLTGTMGVAPVPFYDPLAFVIREAHARGLQVHAWFNPYRALFPGSPGAPSADHVTRADPSAVRRYGSQIWMDPGDPTVVSRTIRAVLDVTERYDVDGIHIDDYFYPYRETDRSGRTIQFPDEASYARYTSAEGTLSLNDWRRFNVDRFVHRIGSEIHKVKPWVLFGVSPFGIWRPGYPPSVRGLDSYEELFADSRKWLREGWVDYLAPQLYWPIGRPQQDFSQLLGWWVSQNVGGRHIWAGLNAALAYNGPPKGRGAAEILDQIRLSRTTPGATGQIFFSAKIFMQDPDSLAERLALGNYAQPAIIPPSPWLWKTAPRAPQAISRMNMTTGAIMIDMDPARGEGAPWQWVLQSRTATGWTTQVVPGSRNTLTLASPGTRSPSEVRVFAVGRTGNMSPPERVFPNGDPLPLSSYGDRR